MTQNIDLTGQSFGRLIVVNFAGRDNKENRKSWLCKCECGNEKVVLEKALNSGNTKSCGCLIVRNGVEKTKHGMTDSKTWGIWRGMMRRCYEVTNQHYHLYGAKGKLVEDRWHTFQNFFEDMGECPENHSLDRINNDLGYSKDNCRWANYETQNNNRGDYNHNITLNGITKTQAQWARELGVNDTTIAGRLKKGWSIEKALTTPVKVYKKRAA